MTLVTLHELQHLTGLSDRAMLHLLEQEGTACVVDADKGLLLDADSVSVKTLVSSLLKRTRDTLDEQENVLVARFSGIIGEHIEEILDDAVQRLALERRISNQDSEENS
jgi:hypothetical protein